MKLNTQVLALCVERVSEAMREIGILWLCFSFLDKIVQGQLTSHWALWNVLASGFIWAWGLYLEILKRKLV
ncbi:MAG: hypothetical protein JWN02_1645 [Acidobacteria bacterium]|nr:hypothetical protein [Acidobacteriota bacterium]